jgi:hypothetical protein
MKALRRGQIYILDVETLRLMQILAGYAEPITSLDWDPHADNSLVCSRCPVQLPVALDTTIAKGEIRNSTAESVRMVPEKLRL